MALRREELSQAMAGGAAGGHGGGVRAGLVECRVGVRVVSKELCQVVVLPGTHCALGRFYGLE